MTTTPEDRTPSPEPSRSERIRKLLTALGLEKTAIDAAMGMGEPPDEYLDRLFGRTEAARIRELEARSTSLHEELKAATAMHDEQLEPLHAAVTDAESASLSAQRALADALADPRALYRDVERLRRAAEHARQSASDARTAYETRLLAKENALTAIYHQISHVRWQISHPPARWEIAPPKAGERLPPRELVTTAAMHECWGAFPKGPPPMGAD